MKKRMTALILALAMLLPLMGAALAEQEIWQRGDRGEKVAEIQARLKALGYLKTAEEGVFDEATEKALTAFQQRSGLLATGMADRKTMEVLFSEKAQEAAEETGDFWLLTNTPGSGRAAFSPPPPRRCPPLRRTWIRPPMPSCGG